MNRTYYYYNCGHSTTQRAVKNYRGHHLCPKCMLGSLQCKLCHCVDCGKNLGFTSPKKHPMRCERCRIAHKKESRLTFRDVNDPPARYYDCKWYMYCLDKASENPRGVLACEGCRRYTQVKDSVDNYICIGDSFETVSSTYRVRGAG